MFRDLLKDGTLLKRVSVLCCIWFTAAICGYAIDLNSSNISGHLFLNQVLFSILIAASKIVLVTFDTCYPAFSRRNLHQYSQFVVIVCFLVLTILVLFHDEHVSFFKMQTRNCNVCVQSPWILVVNLIGTMFIGLFLFYSFLITCKCLEYTWDACYLCIPFKIKIPPQLA